MHSLVHIRAALLSVLPLLLHAFAAAAAAPTLEVALPEGKALPGVPYPVEYVIEWQGEPSEWTIPPPKIDDPDWGEAEVIGVHSSHADGVNTVTFEVLYTFTDPGLYALPELAFFYDAPAPDAAAAEEGATGGGAALLSDRVEVEVIPPPPLWLIPSIVAAVVLSLVVIVVILRRRSRQKRQPQQKLSPFDRAQEILHVARRRRLDGDLYAYYRELGRAMEFVSDDAESKQLLEKLKTRTQEVGYKGMRPSDDLLEGDMRDVERVLARRKEEFGS